MYYLNDISEATFARKKGSKDKKKRLLRNTAIGVGGLVAVGGLGYLASKNKSINNLLSSKKRKNTALVRKRLKAINKHVTEQDKELGNKLLYRLGGKIGKKRSGPKDRLYQLVSRATVRDAVQSLKEKNRYYSIGDVTEFAKSPK
jgi:hypothetical protein